MSVLVKKSGWEHRWHTDVENTIDNLHCKDKSWTAWLPIEGSGDASTLLLVTNTHASDNFAHTLLPKQCKTCASDNQKHSIRARGKILEKFARDEGSSSARLVALAANDGSAWMLRGATWHSSINKSDKTRVAVQMHYMPSYCAFRKDDNEKLHEPPKITATKPRPDGISNVLPAVLPTLGAASPTLTSDQYEVAQRNNWMLPDIPAPVVVQSAELISAAKTQVEEHDLVRFAQDPRRAAQLIHNLNDAGFADQPCGTRYADSRAGGADTRCKLPQVAGKTDQLRLIEYHTSKLIANKYEGEYRSHEEMLMLYVVAGTIKVSILQSPPYEKAVYQKFLDKGDLLYLPSWLPHRFTSVEHDQSVLLSIRYVGEHSVPKPSPERLVTWETVHKVRLDDVKQLAGSDSVVTMVEDATPMLLADSYGTEVDLTNSRADQLLLLADGQLETLNGVHLTAPATWFLPKGTEARVRDRSPGVPRLLRINLSPEPITSVQNVQLAPQYAVPMQVKTNAAVRSRSLSHLHVEPTVDICAVAMGRPSSVFELEMLLRSIRATSARKVRVHVLVSQSTMEVASQLREKTAMAWEEFELVQAEADRIEAMAKAAFPNVDIWAHHSGPWGMAKTFMHTLLDKVDRCIFIDSDMLLMSDVGVLFDKFENFGPKTLMMLQLSESKTEFERDGNHMKMAKKASEICSCIALMHMKRMREMVWDKAMSDGWANYFKNPKGKLRLSNQGIWHLALREINGIGKQILPLDTQWNIAGCQEFNQCSFERDSWLCLDDDNFNQVDVAWAMDRTHFAGAMHANCISPLSEHGSKIRYNGSAEDNAYAGVSADDVVGYKSAGWRGFNKYVNRITSLSWQEAMRSMYPENGRRCRLRASVICTAKS